MSDPSPAERYARGRERPQPPHHRRVRGIPALRARPVPDRGMPRPRGGTQRPGGRAHGCRQDDRRRVRDPPRHARTGEAGAATRPSTRRRSRRCRTRSSASCQDVYGADEVGLLTGDTNINGNARIVVMTTEVLRNMLYADSSALRGLRYVVMDEVHYLADRFRGAVWEEIIIHLPPTVRLVSLSATVSNAEEFGDWLDTVRGDTEVIVSEIRPVPLEQHVLVRGDLLPLFDDRAGIATAQVNQELMRIRSFKGPTFENNRRAQSMRSSSAQNSGRYEGGGRRQSGRRPHKGASVPSGPRTCSASSASTGRMSSSCSQRANLLPAIFFIFSRAGCDAAVQQVRRSGVRLTVQEERLEIRAIVEERTRTLHDEDLAVLGYWEWLDNLERGVAAHHAGLLPAFKEVVEELFKRKLVKVVFATETLALGINMPARTVVLEKLEKFNGEARVAITSGEYTQLTGRAGRRGIDVEGHAVIQWTEGVDPQQVAALASRRTYPLNSSFRPDLQHGGQPHRPVRAREGARDPRVVVRAVPGRPRGRRARAAGARIGGVARRLREGDDLRSRRLRRVLRDPPRAQRPREAQPQGRERLPRRRATPRQRRSPSLRKRMQRHPCHQCPEREQHARWAERYWKLKRQVDKMRRQIETAHRNGRAHLRPGRGRAGRARLRAQSTTTAPTTLTPAGRTMRRIYGERDLLVAESLRTGIWEGPGCRIARRRSPAASSTNRGATRPDPASAAAARGVPRRAQRDAGSVAAPRRPRAGPPACPAPSSLAPASPRRCTPGREGMPLDRVLDEADMAAGDFVRWAKQTIDLLDQLSLVAEPRLPRPRAKPSTPSAAASSLQLRLTPPRRRAYRGAPRSCSASRSCPCGRRSWRPWRPPPARSSTWRIPSVGGGRWPSSACPVALLGAHRPERVGLRWLVGFAFGASSSSCTSRGSRRYLGVVPWFALSMLETVFTGPGPSRSRWRIDGCRGRCRRAGRSSPCFRSSSPGSGPLRELFMGSWPYGGFPWGGIGMSQSESPLAAHRRPGSASRD